MQGWAPSRSTRDPPASPSATQWRLPSTASSTVPGRLDAHLVRHGVNFTGDSVIELLMHGLSSEGPRFLASLNGCFAAALWDRERQRLTLVSDRFGMRPLYWAQTEGGLVFASEIKALLAVPGLSRKTSSEGLGQFFAFGQYLGDRTSFEAISVLPAASVLEFDLPTGRVQVQSYGGVEPTSDLPARDAALDAVADAFVASVERQTGGDERPRPLAFRRARCPDHPRRRP